MEVAFSGGAGGRSGGLGAPKLDLVAIQATGGFETVVAAGLAAAGLRVAIVNPTRVRADAQAPGKRAKTDSIDATVIAHFADATMPEVHSLPDAQARQLADLVTRRRQIGQMLAAECSRAEHAVLTANSACGSSKKLHTLSCNVP